MSAANLSDCDYRRPGVSVITRYARTDVRVVQALRAAGVPLRKREVQMELRGLVDMATELASSMDFRGVMKGDEMKALVAELQQSHRLGHKLSSHDMELLLRAILVARYRYKWERWEDEEDGKVRSAETFRKHTTFPCELV